MLCSCALQLGDFALDLGAIDAGLRGGDELALIC